MYERIVTCALCFLLGAITLGQGIDVNWPRWTKSHAPVSPDVPDKPDPANKVEPVPEPVKPELTRWVKKTQEDVVPASPSKESEKKKMAEIYSTASKRSRDREFRDDAEAQQFVGDQIARNRIPVQWDRFFDLLHERISNDYSGGRPIDAIYGEIAEGLK